MTLKEQLFYFITQVNDFFSQNVVIGKGADTDYSVKYTDIPMNKPNNIKGKISIKEFVDKMKKRDE